MRNKALLIWGRRPQTPAIFRFTARMAGRTINALERRIGLSSDGTRAPTQGPEWLGGGCGRPLKSDSPNANLLRAKNGLDNRDHFRDSRIQPWKHSKILVVEHKGAPGAPCVFRPFGASFQVLGRQTSQANRPAFARRLVIAVWCSHFDRPTTIGTGSSVKRHPHAR